MAQDYFNVPPRLGCGCCWLLHRSLWWAHWLNKSWTCFNRSHLNSQLAKPCWSFNLLPSVFTLQLTDSWTGLGCWSLLPHSVRLTSSSLSAFLRHLQFALFVSVHLAPFLLKINLTTKVTLWAQYQLSLVIIISYEQLSILLWFSSQHSSHSPSHPGLCLVSWTPDVNIQTSSLSKALGSRLLDDKLILAWWHFPFTSSFVVW